MGLTDQEDMLNEFNKLYNSDTEGELDVSNKNRGEENGGWNKYNNELDIIDEEWRDEEDKEISDDSDSEPDLYALTINKKANDLKKQLEQNHSKLIIKEYNYKRAIFEYLSLLSKNNRHRKIKASLDVAHIENTKKQLE
ncbi:3983_t:CDS:2 [Racocetra fulgida]|uniref:3983_t:CDS:1 n=1 Tax=Racocetra fulgida TaxID=60492 RepID=A0A9N9DVU0_9GLOM|nr:3983_t:CDS:2 [Racocetra fulgida]